MDPSPSKPWWRRWFGTRSERSAVRFLKQLGYRILARNYTCVFGEIDVIALDAACIVFVEVRSTESENVQQPAATVDMKKQQRLTRLALHYLKRNRLLDQQARFDVLSISWPPGQKKPAVNHLRSAFEACGGRGQFYC
jgi:putative endonuclease